MSIKFGAVVTVRSVLVVFAILLPVMELSIKVLTADDLSSFFCIRCFVHLIFSLSV
jgi:hypothetical protein